MKNSNKFLRLLSIPYLIWMIIFIVLPVFLVFLYSITKNSSGFFNITFTLDNYKNFFASSVYVKALFRSIYLAILATILTIIIGYPVAYFLAQFKSKKRNLILLLLIVPMWTNMLLRTYAWRYILYPNGIINKLLGFVGIPPLELMNTAFSVALGMTYNYLPFMILPIFSVLVKLDKDFIYAAYDLGANRFKTFTKVVFPLSIPGVISGVTMVFLPSATSFIIPQYLGGGKQNLFGNIIEDQFKGKVQNPNFGSALAIILMLLIFGFISLTSLKKGKESGESLW